MLLKISIIARSDAISQYITFKYLEEFLSINQSNINIFIKYIIIALNVSINIKVKQIASSSIKIRFIKTWSTHRLIKNSNLSSLY